MKRKKCFLDCALLKSSDLQIRKDATSLIFHDKNRPMT